MCHLTLLSFTPLCFLVSLFLFFIVALILSNNPFSFLPHVCIWVYMSLYRMILHVREHILIFFIHYPSIFPSLPCLYTFFSPSTVHFLLSCQIFKYITYIKIDIPYMIENMYYISFLVWYISFNLMISS